VRISQKKKGNNRVVEVAGTLTVANNPRLKKAVLENLRKGNHLELVIADVTDVDLSFIQIIAAAMKMAEKSDREFTVRTPVPGPVLKSVKLSGLLNHDKCSKPNCVWCSINGQILRSVGDE
jgi:anti-anti-sigma regulatory factor